MVDTLLRNSEIAASELSCIAVAAGPGSFTGIRIGCATAKGLAYALDIETRAVSTLAAMADYAAVWNDEPPLIVGSPYGKVIHPYILSCEMDARRGQLYNALFRVTGNAVQRITPDRVILREELEDEFAEFSSKNDTIIKSDRLSAVGVALAAEATVPGEANPVYLRKPQAEREYEKRHNILNNNRGG
jgi:tRNA threonylcarbamoyladenosine biosynthesis protein TsaB